MTPDDILDKAIHILERDGWHKGGLAYVPYPDDDFESTEDDVAYAHWQAMRNAPVCAIGALNRAYTGDANGRWTLDEDAPREALVRLIEASGVPHSNDIPEWNDDENTTKEDVVLAFKRARRGE